MRQSINRKRNLNWNGGKGVILRGFRIVTHTDIVQWGLPPT